MGKEVTTYLCCEVAVDRKIVPFERVPDHAGGNYSASLCGVHLTPSLGQALSHSASAWSISSSLVAFNTMSSSRAPRLPDGPPPEIRKTETRNNGLTPFLPESANRQRATMQPPQGLDATHSGEPFPVNESCAAPHACWQAVFFKLRKNPGRTRRG